MAALLVVYGPALNGGFVCDDDAWTSKLAPLFSASDVLGRMWANDPLLQQFITLLLGVLVWRLETDRVGAEVGEFKATLVQRTLNAGRVVCFFLWKLLWPADRCVIYLDWCLEHAAWWHWLSPMS